MCTADAQLIEFNGRALCTSCFAIELESIDQYDGQRIHHSR